MLPATHRMMPMTTVMVAKGLRTIQSARKPPDGGGAKAWKDMLIMTEMMATFAIA